MNYLREHLSCIEIKKKIPWLLPRDFLFLDDSMANVFQDEDYQIYHQILSR